MVVTDPTQQAEGDAAQWAREPLGERHESLAVHTERPFNAEPPNEALRCMITPDNLHYRRTHTPVPLLEEASYRVRIGFEGSGDASYQAFSVPELKSSFPHKDLIVSLMCTGNRRSEMNTKEDGETMGLPWKNGSIGTAKWTGVCLRDVLHKCGIADDLCRRDGFRFLTFWGLEDYHVSIPIKKALDPDGECVLVWSMNDRPLLRDHGFPLRVIVPGYVGARSVKWLDRIVVSKNEVDGMHQKGIAYKQLGPNQKSLGSVAKSYIESLPPVDHTPLTSAITSPEPGAKVGLPGETMPEITGYALSGAGAAIIRVDVSVDGGKTWSQAEVIERASEEQSVRSGKAWAWVQWRKRGAKVPQSCGPGGKAVIVCKAVDDQYQQQPHEVAPIWNLRGILNSAWPRVVVETGAETEMHPDARSGDGSMNNVGLKLDGKFQCPFCNQRFGCEKGFRLHCNFVHTDKIGLLDCAIKQVV